MRCNRFWVHIDAHEKGHPTESPLNKNEIHKKKESIAII